MRKHFVFHRNHGLTPLENFDFSDFSKTSLLMSKQHSYLSRISKNRLFLLNLPNKYLWGNIRFFHKNHELTPLENFDFLGFFKTLHFWSKHILFSPQYQKTIFFSGLICPKLKKKYGLTPLENFDFTDFFKTNPFEKFRFFGLFKNFTFLV